MKKILTGLTANKGKILGEVFVIDESKEISKFKSGSILVCRLTNPAYVPAMAEAIGIITDIGGITSHAAIVARELGVPCVVGTKNGSEKLQTGQKILLDADNGAIYEIK
jgi:pyruvate,water dikinase